MNDLVVIQHGKGEYVAFDPWDVNVVVSEGLEDCRFKVKSDPANWHRVSLPIGAFLMQLKAARAQMEEKG